MKKRISLIVMLIGIILLMIGLFLPLPGDELTTSSLLDGEENYSAIEEYVGGDAYNYIIGATLIGAKITGILVMKAIFIGVGVLIFSIGLISFYFISDKENITIPLDSKLTIQDETKDSGELNKI